MKNFFKSKEKDGVKVPFYKRKWFFVLAALLVFVAIFYEEDKPEEAIVNDPPPPIEEVASKDISKEELKKEKKPEMLADLDPQDILNKSKFKVNIMTSSDWFIEEYEKQKIRKNKFDMSVYSTDTIKDQSGVEFPYSFMVTGRYEEKGSGALKDYVMTLGFKDAQGLEDGKAFCIQYLNDDTGTYVNVMDPEDDAIMKMLELLEGD